MKQFLLLFLIFYAGICSAQHLTDIENKDSAQAKTINTLKSKPIFNNQFSLPTSALLFDRSPVFMPVIPNLYLPAPKFNFQSFTTDFVTIPNPTDNLYNQFYINNRNWISTAKTSTNFIGLGGISLAGASYNTKLGDFAILTGGLYASKYNIYNNFYTNFGVNGNVKLILSNRLSLNMYGQYSGKQPVTLYPLIQNMFPQNYYGGSIEFKVNENWGLITGANREFDIIKRKWVTQPFIMPIFYKLGH